MSEHVVRPIDRDSADEIELVAQRMRLTLIEVLGQEIGASMYSLEWLRERARWHLDPAQCTGEILVAEASGSLVGHTIVRLEPDSAGDTVGLFSTIYVVPEARRRGIADALVRRGEAWLASHGMKSAGTSTSETNSQLISLFTKHGYEVVLRVPESRMVHLSKRLGAARR